MAETNQQTYNSGFWENYFNKPNNILTDCFVKYKTFILKFGRYWVENITTVFLTANVN